MGWKQNSPPFGGRLLFPRAPTAWRGSWQHLALPLSSHLKRLWAAAPTAGWLQVTGWGPAVNGSSRASLAMATKRQKLCGNIIEFSLSIVAVCSWPNKEGTSWISKKKKIWSTLSNASLMAFHCQRGQQANQSLRRIGCPSPGLCA